MDTRVEATVGIGSWVVLRELNGARDESWRIVEHHEANPLEGRLSELCPLAQAILGKCQGDRLKVSVLGTAGSWPVEILYVGNQPRPEGEEGADGDSV